jgi:hypothetical protein
MITAANIKLANLLADFFPIVALDDVNYDKGTFVTVIGKGGEIGQK